MKTFAKTVTGEALARQIVHTLLSQSQFFQLMPLPDDKWEIVVREENKTKLQRLAQPIEQPNQVDAGAENDDVEPPALSLENPNESGNDYVFNEGHHRGCWIAMRNVSAHIFLTSDEQGVQIHLHARDAEGAVDVDELDSVFVGFPATES